MTNTTNTISDEQANAMREQLAHYQRQKDYEVALKRKELHDTVKPVVESREFGKLFAVVEELKAGSLKDDMYFSLGIDAIYNGMVNLRNNVQNWTDPVDPNAPVVTPTPSTEGNSDGQ